MRSLLPAVVVALAALLAVTGGCGRESSHMSGGRYFDTEHKFSIELPRGWERREDFSGSVVSALRPADNETKEFRENVGVLVEEVPPTTGLKDYMVATVENAGRVLSGFRVLDAGDITLAGGSGAWLAYSHNVEGMSLDVLLYATLSGGRACVIVCSAKSDRMSRFRRLFERVASSFRLED